MNIADRIEAAKPYALGIVLGLVAAPIIAFGAGWVVTSANKAEAIRSAQVDTVAAICAENAKESWTSQNMKLAALEGWDNRDTREKLVETTLADFISVPDELSEDVADECDDLLS